MVKSSRRIAPKRHRPFRVKDYLLAAGLALLIVWLVFLNVSIFRKEQIAQAAARASHAQLTSLSTREKTLQANVNELSTERGQEATLRDTYGVAKPGEGVIIVVPQTSVATSTPPLTFWQRWFGWLHF